MTSNAHLETGLVIKNFIKNTAYSISHLDKNHTLHASPRYVVIDFLIDAPKDYLSSQAHTEPPLITLLFDRASCQRSLQRTAIKYAVSSRLIPLILCTGLKMPSAY